jgi:hypothetical protein
MAFPKEVSDRFLAEGDIIALKMLDGIQTHLYPFQVDTIEVPNNYAQFSIGSATALATAGTGWNTIQDTSNRYILEPESSGIIYQVFFGVYPSFARVYRQYPSGVDRGSLTGTRSPGTDPIGFISGDMSPLLFPSVVTEFFTLRGNHPAFYGYHPYGRPATVNVRLNFYIAVYGVSGIRRNNDDAWITENSRRIITMGGRTLMQAPTWVKEDTNMPTNALVRSR